MLYGASQHEVKSRGTWMKREDGEQGIPEWL